MSKKSSGLSPYSKKVKELVDYYGSVKTTSKETKIRRSSLDNIFSGEAKRAYSSTKAGINKSYRHMIKLKDKAESKKVEKVEKAEKLGVSALAYGVKIPYTEFDEKFGLSVILGSIGFKGKRYVELKSGDAFWGNGDSVYVLKASYIRKSLLKDTIVPKIGSLESRLENANPEELRVMPEELRVMRDELNRIKDKVKGILIG